MAKTKRVYTEEEKVGFARESKERMDEALVMLENGVKEVFESGRFQEYLKFASTFYDYSFRNQLLIMIQNPEARYVAGFKAWNDKYNRHVKKGEKGIKIFAPAPYKIIVQNEDVDDEEETRMRFKVTSVFGDNQTEGEPLPEICKVLDGQVDNAGEILSKLERVAPVPIQYKEINNCHGYFSPSEHVICVDSRMPQMQMVKTLIHEIAHSFLHCEGGEEEKADRETKEVQAESIAYVVMNHIGLDSGDYTFEYVASWSKDKEVKQLKASLDVISKTASEIIKKLAA